jgi:hypothetical protein
MTIRPVGTELFHADGQTDTKKLAVAFRNSENEPKAELRKALAQAHTVSLNISPV